MYTAESHLNCKAIGDAHLAYIKNGITYGKSYGIAQIRYLPGRPTPEKLLDCKYNIDLAKTYRDAQGWKIWSAYTNKSYLLYY